MKPIRNVFVRREEKPNYVCVGSAFRGVVSYTINDFYTPAQVAEKCGISRVDAKKFMQTLKTRGAVFVLNDHKTPIVIRRTKTSGLYVHAMGLDAFKQELIKEQRKITK